MSNEITAYFKGTTGVAESVYQHDYGMIMNIDGLTLSETFDVHFEVSGSASTITAIGSNNKVAIPNDCLAVPGKLTAYIYTHTGSHDGETAYVVTFQVINRARPDDDITDATEESNAKAIVRLQAEHEEDVERIETRIETDEAESDALKRRVTTAEDDIDLLENRINTAISAVTTDTEVTDIRNGADGINVYSTAGVAVRSQISDLKRANSNCENAIIGTNNDLDVSYEPKLINGRIDSHTDPVVFVTADTSRVITFDIIDLSLYDRMKVIMSNGYNVSVFIYGDKDQESSYITGSSWLTEADYFLTKKYYRFLFRKTDNSTITPAEALANCSIVLTKATAEDDYNLMSFSNSTAPMDSTILQDTGYISTSNGIVQAGNDSKHSRLYRAIPGDKIEGVSAEQSSRPILVVFDKDGSITYSELGSGINALTSFSYTFTDDDVWFVLSCRTARIDDFNAIYKSNQSAHKLLDNLKVVATEKDFIENFQIGGFNASGHWWISSTKEIIVREDFPIKLNAGDKVYLTSYENGLHFRPIVLVDNVYTAKSWVYSGVYIVESSGDHWFEINTGATITNMDDVRNLFRVEKYVGTLDAIKESNVVNQRTDFHVKSINHRGMNLIAPENTLPAFKLSAKFGWKYVETDIAKTSDGVLVLLHDSTINRTARNEDGSVIENTIAISDITYDQALDYDFGIWKGTQYAGTKIPTLDEFLKLCRKLSLYPYLDLGSSTDIETIDAVVASVKRNGISYNATIVASNVEALSRVKEKCDYMRLGIIGSPSSDLIEDVEALRTGKNEVFIDAQTGTYSSDATIQLLIDADVPLETYTPNSTSGILAIDPYVSGITSDFLVAGRILYNDANN